MIFKSNVNFNFWTSYRFVKNEENIFYLEKDARNIFSFKSFAKEISKM